MNQPNQPPVPGIKPPGDGKATGALICGIIALVCSIPILSIVGIILAKGAEEEGYVGNKAKIGRILSIIAIAVSVLFWGFLFACGGFAVLFDSF